SLDLRQFLDADEGELRPLVFIESLFVSQVIEVNAGTRNSLARAQVVIGEIDALGLSRWHAAKRPVEVDCLLDELKQALVFLSQEKNAAVRIVQITVTGRVVFWQREVRHRGLRDEPFRF